MSDVGSPVSQCLGLVDFAVLPQLNNERYQSNTVQQLPALLHGYSGPVCAISGDSAVVNSDVCYVLGNRPVTINRDVDIIAA